MTGTRSTSGCSLGTRLLVLALLCLFHASGRVAAQSSSTVPTLATLSDCARNCLFQGIAQSGCSPLDVACQCASQVQADETLGCLLGNCTMQEGLDLTRFTAATCNLPHESRADGVIVMMTILFGISMIFVILRVMSKMLSQTLCSEDYIIVAALLLAITPAAAVLVMARIGFGKHIWDLQNGALSKILQLFYISEIVYVVALALIKTSLVFMYLRIFWAYKPFKIACYSVLAFIILPSAAIVLVTILSCSPIPYFWERDIPDGQCINVSALAYANSAFAVAQDAILIFLPIFMLWSLNMSRKKKLLIGLMFAMGSLGLVATIIRLRTLYVFGDLSDPTWDYVPVVYWTTIELAAGVIASCMPAVRKLLERWFGAVFNIGSTAQSSGRNGSGPSIRLERQRKPSAARAGMDSLWKDDIWDGSGQMPQRSSLAAGLRPIWKKDIWDGSSSRGLTSSGRTSSGSPKRLMTAETRDEFNTNAHTDLEVGSGF